MSQYLGVNALVQICLEQYLGYFKCWVNIDLLLKIFFYLGGFFGLEGFLDSILFNFVLGIGIFLIIFLKYFLYIFSDGEFIFRKFVLCVGYFCMELKFVEFQRFFWKVLLVFWVLDSFWGFGYVVVGGQIQGQYYFFFRGFGVSIFQFYGFVYEIGLRECCLYQFFLFLSLFFTEVQYFIVC